VVYSAIDTVYRDVGATLQEAFLRISHKSKYLECLSYRTGIKNDFLSLLRSCGKPMWLSTF